MYPSTDNIWLFSKYKPEERDGIPAARTSPVAPPQKKPCFAIPPFLCAVQDRERRVYICIYFSVEVRIKDGDGMRFWMGFVFVGKPRG